MKRIISLLIVLLMILSLVSCSITFTPSATDEESTEQDGTPFSEPDDTENSENGTPAGNPQPANDDIKELDKSVTIEECVIYDEDGIRITATELEYTNYCVKLWFTIENASDKDLSFISGSLGYSCNSINGYMAEYGYMNCSVAAGKKAVDSIDFDFTDLAFCGITEIADFEIAIDMCDDDYNHVHTGPLQIRTSAYENHDYSGDCYTATLRNPAAMKEFKYNLLHFGTDANYNENGLTLISEALIENKDGETALLLEFENTSDAQITERINKISINGLIVCDSNWSSAMVNAGKRAVISVLLSNAFPTEYWTHYGLSDVSKVGITICQEKDEWYETTDPVEFTVTVPNTECVLDASGTEIYSNNGLVIKYKTIAADTSKYLDNIHVLLYIENESGKELTVDDVYNSLSVNGFMTDSSFYSLTLKNGEKAALDVELWGSSLEKNRIDGADAIETIEFGLEVSEGYDTVDETVITITAK